MLWIMKNVAPVAALIWFLLFGCAHAFRPAPLNVTSTDFRAWTTLPDSSVLDGLDCHGANVSPEIEWLGAPAATKSYALVLDDYMARGGDGFVHWGAYNIPARVTSLPRNAGAEEGDLPGGGRQVWNDFLKRNYGGPCPPDGPAHRYRFTVFALDLPEIDDAGTPMTWRKLRYIIQGHIVAQGSLTGLRAH